MKIVQTLNGACRATAEILEAWLGPLALLSLRVWVALAFWHAGVVKFADPAGTQYLFESVYHVPLLSPDFAATLGTWIELIAPWLLAIGLCGRLTALFLFVYNIMAFTSFPALWPHGFWTDFFNTTAFADHKVWGLMLLVLIAFGPGRLSLDGLLRAVRHRWCRCAARVSLAG